MCAYPDFRSPFLCIKWQMETLKKSIPMTTASFPVCFSPDFIFGLFCKIYAKKTPSAYFVYLFALLFSFVESNHSTQMLPIFRSNRTGARIFTFKISLYLLSQHANYSAKRFWGIRVSIFCWVFNAVTLFKDYFTGIFTLHNIFNLFFRFNPKTKILVCIEERIFWIYPCLESPLCEIPLWVFLWMKWSSQGKTNLIRCWPSKYTTLHLHTLYSWPNLDRGRS